MPNLAVYIHWPFCKSKCPYCDFNSHVRDNVEQERWKAALLAELAHMHQYVPDFTVTSIFFGGGTPSLMPAATVEALIKEVGKLWKTGSDIEITLEANPTSVEVKSFPDFKAAGVNRVSLGVQSLRERELKFLGREHSASEAIKAIELARKNFDRYSFDLIYARPGQSVKDWDAELSEALKLAGSHMSLYQLTIEENTAFHHAYAKGGFTLPNEEEAEELYRFTEDKMAAHGLIAYEVSNYSKPGEESRHNMSYWQGDSYVGIGPGAHGRISLLPPLRGKSSPNSLPPCGGGLRVGGKNKTPSHREYLPYIKEFARSLRNNQTEAEKKLWQLLRGNNLGLKFRRQFAVDNKYIADFICLEKRLIIEIDGGQHSENIKDAERTLYLENQDFRVIRFWNNEIFQNLEVCYKILLEELNKDTPLPSPPPQGGRENKRIATQTLKSPERWLENVEKNGHAVEVWQEIDPQTEIEERLMMGLRLRSGINYVQFQIQTGHDLREHINLKKRDLYIKNGLLALDSENLKATINGRLLLNKLTAELL